MFRLFLLAVASVFLMSCVKGQGLPDRSLAVPGRVVETISSTVILSLNTTDRNFTGRGVMVYRRPDQIRLVLLSPFGTTLMEMKLNGEQLTLTYPADGVAYQGRIADLPASTGQRGFTMLRWVLDSDPPSGAPDNGEIEQKARNGALERIVLEDGLVLEKNLSTGERVRYRDYKALSGVRMAFEILMDSAEGDRIKLTLEEPDINTTLEESLFNVSLAGLHLLPLSRLISR